MKFPSKGYFHAKPIGKPLSYVWLLLLAIARGPLCRSAHKEHLDNLEKIKVRGRA